MTAHYKKTVNKCISKGLTVKSPLQVLVFTLLADGRVICGTGSENAILRSWRLSLQVGQF
jgi:hypothetical protein